MMKNLFKTLACCLLSCFLVLVPMTLRAAEAPLKICVTVPELGSLAEEIGGDQIRVTVFAKGTEDPHYLDAKPSFIKALSEADLFIQVGMELEAGWAPLLLRSSRNRKVQPGGPGYLDASVGISPLEVPTGILDRTMGDVHPQGNPHYLADPLNGLKVAALIRDRLSELRPAAQALFAERYRDFRERLGAAVVGKALAAKYEFEKLALLHQHGKLAEFLGKQGDAPLLGGWLGKLQPHFGEKILTYHKSWPYLAERFGLIVAGQLEPKPGIPPGPGHLLQVVKMGKAEKVRVILMEPWLNRKPAKLVAGRIGARIAQASTSSVGGDGPYSYLASMDYLVSRLVEGLALSD